MPCVRLWHCTKQSRHMEAEAVINLQEIVIEPLDPAKHDRAAFFCGVARLDNFLKRTARKQQAGDFTRVWVAAKSEQPAILSYYALNAHFVEGDGLPTHLTKDAPRSGCIPAVYFSMIAVAHRFQGQKLGHVLLADALNRAVGAADGYLGLKLVVLDVIEDGGTDNTEKRRAFYASMGFRTFPSNPLRMFITIETVRRAKH